MRVIDENTNFSCITGRFIAIADFGSVMGYKTGYSLNEVMKSYESAKTYKIESDEVVMYGVDSGKLNFVKYRRIKPNVTAEQMFELKANLKNPEIVDRYTEKLGNEVQRVINTKVPQ